MTHALLFGVAAALATFFLHPLINRAIGSPTPDRALLIGSTAIVGGAVFGALFFDEVLHIPVGGALAGGGVGFLVAAVTTGLFRR